MAKQYDHIETEHPNMNLYRFFSFFVDIILCGMLSLPFVMFFGGAGITSAKQFILTWIPFFIQFLIFKDIFGRSFGKLLFGFGIVEEGTDLRAPFFRRILRNLPLIVFPLECVAVLISDSNTRIADKIFGLRVVRVRI